jgi:lysozyme
MTEAVVSHLVRVLSQCQFDALVSFTFNLGACNPASPTLLWDLNAGDVADADKQFVCLDHAGNVEVGSLRERRLAEAAMFAGGAFYIYFVPACLRYSLKRH